MNVPRMAIGRVMGKKDKQLYFLQEQNKVKKTAKIKIQISKIIQSLATNKIYRKNNSLNN